MVQLRRHKDSPGSRCRKARVIADNPELADELEAKIMEAMKEAAEKGNKSGKAKITIKTKKEEAAPKAKGGR